MRWWGWGGTQPHQSGTKGNLFSISWLCLQNRGCSILQQPHFPFQAELFQKGKPPGCGNLGSFVGDCWGFFFLGKEGGQGVAADFWNQLETGELCKIWRLFFLNSRYRIAWCCAYINKLSGVSWQSTVPVLLWESSETIWEKKCPSQC